MEHVLELLRIMQQNYSQDMIYFERIVHEETKKYVSLWAENDKIEMFHKVTSSSKGFYTPSADFTELAEAFISYNKATLRMYEIEAIRTVFEKHKIKKQFI